MRYIRLISGLLVFLLLFSFNALMAQPGFGHAQNMNGDWKFNLGDIDNGYAIDYDTRSWQTIRLPHDWSVRQPLSPTLASATGYLPGGIGWYRKNITIPKDKENEKIYLYFEGVYNRSEVFINGHSLGFRPNGYVSFMYDATPYVKFGSENIIAVRVDHSNDADSRWYTGSGIYRDVWMVAAPKVHLSQWGVYAYPEVKNNKGTLHVEVSVSNHVATTEQVVLLHELLDNTGKIVATKRSKLAIKPGEENQVNVSLDVRNPQLWDLNNPVLYTLNTKLLKEGKQIDETSVRTGFRTFTFDPNKGFALNGTWMKMKGVCLHHDTGVLGAAVYPEVWRRRLLTLKELGVNAIRTSHNPQATSLYELCDELGILVMNEAYDEWEFPKRKWLEGWNVGTPGFQGSYDYFEEWGERDLADMVRRDRNHISIFAWSIGNEVDYPNDPYSHPVLDGSREGGFTQAIFGGYKPDAPDAMRLGAIAKRLAAVVKQHDKSRAVTAGLAGVAMSNETEYPFALDIAGYNYTESRYQQDHERYPERVIYGSENRHDYDAWKSVRDNEHIFGQFLWTGIDYLGESGRWPSRGFYSGLLDFGGFKKPRGYFRQALWSDEPVSYLGTYPSPHSRRAVVNEGGSVLDDTESLERNDNRPPSMDAWPIWNYEEGEIIRVVCYTNASSAQLVLNGKPVGAVRHQDDVHGILYWDIPYASGKLEVIGLNEHGVEITRNAIQSSNRSYSLQLISEESTVNADGGVAQLAIQVVDEHGVPVVLADDEVTCEIVGPGRLLGLESSNNSDMSDYTDNRHRVYRGRLVAFVQSVGNPGEKIEVRFDASWLKSVSSVLELK